jgi:hypothetical protein
MPTARPRSRVQHSIQQRFGVISFGFLCCLVACVQVGDTIADAKHRGNFGTACKYVDHAAVVRRGGNQAGHGQIARYPPVVKLILAGCSINMPCFRCPQSDGCDATARISTADLDYVANELIQTDSGGPWAGKSQATKQEGRSPTSTAVEQSVSGRGLTKDSLDSANQFRVRERLGDTSKLFHPRIKPVAESGHEQDGDARVHFSNVLYQVSTCHARHDDVGEKEVDDATMLLEHVERLCATAGVQDRKPSSLQDCANKTANHGLIIDNEYTWYRGGLHNDFLRQRV